MSTPLRPWLRATSCVVLVTLLGACAHRQAPVFEESGTRAGQVATNQHGTVQSIEGIGSRESTSGAGALIGGVVGAVVGRQLGGSSNGRTAGTMVGAIGGAVLGNELEKQHKDTPARYRVVVRMDGGSERVFNVADLQDLRVGERVLVSGNRLQRE